MTEIQNKSMFEANKSARQLKSEFNDREHKIGQLEQEVGMQNKLINEYQVKVQEMEDRYQKLRLELGAKNDQDSNSLIQHYKEKIMELQNENAQLRQQVSRDTEEIHNLNVRRNTTTVEVRENPVNQDLKFQLGQLRKENDFMR